MRMPPLRAMEGGKRNAGDVVRGRWRGCGAGKDVWRGWRQPRGRVAEAGEQLALATPDVDHLWMEDERRVVSTIANTHLTNAFVSHGVEDPASPL